MVEVVSGAIEEEAAVGFMEERRIEDVVVSGTEIYVCFYETLAIYSFNLFCL